MNDYVFPNGSIVVDGNNVGMITNFPGLIKAERRGLTVSHFYLDLKGNDAVLRAVYEDRLPSLARAQIEAYLYIGKPSNETVTVGPKRNVDRGERYLGADGQIQTHTTQSIVNARPVIGSTEFEAGHLVTSNGITYLMVTDPDFPSFRLGVQLTPGDRYGAIIEFSSTQVLTFLDRRYQIVDNKYVAFNAQLRLNKLLSDRRSEPVFNGYTYVSFMSAVDAAYKFWMTSSIDNAYHLGLTVNGKLYVSLGTYLSAVIALLESSVPVTVR